MQQEAISTTKQIHAACEKSFREWIVHNRIKISVVVTSVAVKDCLVWRYGFPDLVENVRFLGIKSSRVPNFLKVDENLERGKTECEMLCTRKTSGTATSSSFTSSSPPTSSLSHFLLLVAFVKS